MQLEKGLQSVKQLTDCIIAYEPVWAIGTGLSASIDQVEEAHNWIRNILHGIYDKSINNHIIYGGSVNKKNADELINVSSVDGFLIGGASLDSESFKSIIKIVQIS